VNVRRRSVDDLGFSAVLGEAQGMYSVDSPDARVPESVTFAFGRGAEVVVDVGVGVGSHERDPMMFKFLSGLLRLVRVG
jgi:hypothetical protein